MLNPGKLLLKIYLSVALGFIIGLGVSVASAQQSVTLGLDQAFLVLAESAGYSVVASGIPEDSKVVLSSTLPNNALEVIANLAIGNGLYVCLNEHVILISQGGCSEKERYKFISALDDMAFDSNSNGVFNDANYPVGANSTGGAGYTCDNEVDCTNDNGLYPVGTNGNSGDILSSGESSVGGASDGAREVAAETAKPVSVRLRVLEIAENEGVSLGLEWRSQAFADLLAYAVGDIYAPYRLLTSELASSIRLAESEGIGRKLDDVSLVGASGVPLRFQAGGNLNVNLVGAGQENLSASYPYGLSVEVTVNGFGDVYTLEYSIDSSSPVSASDPELINVASRTISSEVSLACGEAVVVSAFRQDYADETGSGIPGLGSLPAVGYAFGVGTSTNSITTLLVTLELGCEAA